MGVRLPEEYQEVECIVNSGSQYINTGIYCQSNNVEVEIDYEQGSTWIDGRERDFFTNQSFYDPKFVIGINSSREIFAYSRNGQSTADPNASILNARLNTRYLIRVKYDSITAKKTIDVNGTTSTVTYGGHIANNNTPIYLFTSTDVSSSSTIPNEKSPAGKIFYVIYKEDNRKVLHLIPCYRKLDNKPGMYDLVSGEFFVNQGTGEFVAGPDVIDSISPLMVAWRRMLMMQRKPTIIIPLLYSRGLTNSYGVYYGNAKRACSTEDILVMAGETIKITKPSSVDIGIYTWDENTKQLVFVGNWNESLSAYTPSTNEFYRITIRTNPEHDINNGEVSNIITAVKGTQKYIFV